MNRLFEKNTMEMEGFPSVGMIQNYKPKDKYVNQ